METWNFNNKNKSFSIFSKLNDNTNSNKTIFKKTSYSVVSLITNLNLIENNYKQFYQQFAIL